MKRLISFKARILLFTGSLIVLLMMAISINVIFQWRALIVADQTESALSVTRAFSVSIIDALIYQESGLLQSEGYIENHIHNFLKKNNQVKFIVVYDRENNILIQSSYNEWENKLSNLREENPFTNEEYSQTLIYNHNDFGWIIETIMPLQISGKSWGGLRMGFDAELARQKIRQLFFSLILFTVVLVFVVLTTLYFMIGRLTKSLTFFVAEIDQFDLDNEQPTRMKISNDEIGFIVKHFEKMKQRLAMSRRQLLDAQKQIYQAEKLASIGRLASGVAHEVNNPLNGIKNCLYSIEKEPDNTEQLYKYLKLANEGLDRIADIVKKLLGFSRQTTRQVTEIEINAEIEKVISLIEYRLEKNQIKLIKEFSKNLPPVSADNHLFQEVIMNLLLNSFDSIKEKGTIKIKTKMKDEQNVYIIIEDTGSGIPEQEINYIFDPFYTTKEEGKGTGLGLSVSLGIIESHNGKIDVESKMGKGSVFTISLPVKDKQ